MKKFTALILLLLMCLSLSSCGLLFTLRNPYSDRQETVVNYPAKCDLSDSEANQFKLVSLEGNYEREDTYIENLYQVNPLHTDVVGRVGCPVEVHSTNLGNSSINFYYDLEDMQNVTVENLILLHYHPDTASYDVIPSEADTAHHVVYARISETGVYLVADAYQWCSAWGLDVSQYIQPNIYENKEFKFQLSVPEEIEMKPFTGFLQNDEDGRYEALLGCKINDQMQISIDYLERPFYDSPNEFENELLSELNQIGSLQNHDSIITPSGAEGFYLCSTINHSQYTVSCIFPMTNTQYIHIQYDFTGKDFLPKVMDSLESFDFYGEPDLPKSDEPYEFTKYKDIYGKEISIQLPDELSADVVEQDWVNEFKDHDIVRVHTPLLQINEKTYPEYLIHSSIFLKESKLNPRKEARTLLEEYSAESGCSVLNMEQINIADNQTGYLFSVHDAPNLHYLLYGFYTIPGSHQYLEVSFTLKSSSSDDICQKYWDALRTVNTHASDQAITPENLSITFPENFYANPVHRDWGRERDGDGNPWYRLWLLETDHQKCREVNNHDYSAAFFYLIDTGRPAAVDIQQVEDRGVTQDDHYVDQKEEITLSDGQKGYLLCIRVKSSDDESDYRSCYMYGYYEIPDTNQYVQITFTLNEPVSDKVYQDYWNCLKSVDIHLNP